MRVTREAQRYVVRGVLRQAQDRPFDLDVPVVLRSKQGVTQHVVTLHGNRTTFELASDTAPIALEIDPEFDLFRLLDARETAPSLGQLFGEGEVLAVLPAKAPPAFVQAYRDMLQFWSGGGAQKFRIVTDAAAVTLPTDRAVWVLGADNAYATKLFAGDAALGFAVDGQSIRAGGTRLPKQGRANVIVRRHPGNAAKAIAWLTLDDVAAAAGLARKLPHYGKYSWLSFAGDEPANVAKGEWSAADSPLIVDLRAPDARAEALPVGGYAKREALARLPAVFDATAMTAHIAWLADPAREGRGLGSAGLQAAADYVAKAFAAAGLQPADANGWFQDFEYTPAGAQKSLALRNVVGVLRGTNPRYADQAVVVSAHYDHLGRSGPGVRVAEIGQIHPGADDNASGVAVLIELARTLATAGAPERSVIFVAFSGEEAGLQGSKWFVEHPRGAPLAGIRAVVNLDTVGRLGAGELSVLGTGTASEWQHVFRGITFSTGIAIKNVPGASQSSDQQSFIDRGIPGVQLFTAAHLDYHRPTDTADRIDAAGLVKVATVAREAIDYLAQRDAPLSVTTAPQPASAAGAPSEGARRVSFGLVPDYAHQGPGIRAESVVPDSPAARAGLQAGDLVLAFGDVPIAGLAAFSDTLKKHVAGDRIPTRVRRAEREFVVDVELIAR
ncbi:MAG: M20/M25/M40 family metallo-hydrolase [Steroidobacteraceae bacterium]